MKRIIYLIPAALLTLAACSNNKTADTSAADSAAIADSIAAAEKAAENARLDSIRQDSINQAQAEEMYASALTLTPGKKAIKQGPGECYNISMPVTVTNNTDITLEPSDYIVNYTEVYETSSDGTTPPAYTKKSATGSTIAPGASATVTLTGKCIHDLTKPSVKLKLSKEEFAARRAAK